VIKGITASLGTPSQIAGVHGDHPAAQVPRRLDPRRPAISKGRRGSMEAGECRAAHVVHRHQLRA
jgi:hypothetical protein